MKIQSIEDLQRLADACRTHSQVLAQIKEIMSTYEWGDPRNELMELCEALSAASVAIDGRTCSLLFGGTNTTKPMMYLVYGPPVEAIGCGSGTN